MSSFSSKYILRSQLVARGYRSRAGQGGGDQVRYRTTLELGSCQHGKASRAKAPDCGEENIHLYCLEGPRDGNSEIKVEFILSRSSFPSPLSTCSSLNRTRSHSRDI